MNRLLIEDGKRTLFSDEHPEGQPFDGEVGDDWLVQIRSLPREGAPARVDCGGKTFKTLVGFTTRVDQGSILEAFLENQPDGSLLISSTPREHPLLAYKRGFVNDLVVHNEVFTDADGVRWINGERVADLPPGQMRSRLLGIPGTTEAERVARAAKMAEVFATGAVHIPSRLHEDSTGAIPLSDLAARLSSFKNIEEMADYVGDEGSGALAAASLEPLDYLEGFPDYERVLEARNLTANDMIREPTEFDQIPRSDRLRAFREGFEALEPGNILDIASLPPQVEPFVYPGLPSYAEERRIHQEAMFPPSPLKPEHLLGSGNHDSRAQKPPKTDPNSLLQALFRWGEARAEEEIRLSPKLFALVTEAVFPSGETVLERFLASARVVKPYFRAEVSENGLKLTDLEGI